MTFADGDLETINGNNGFFGDASAGAYPLIERSRWNGTGYEGVTNNEFVARNATPPLRARQLDPGHCPSQGRFRATVSADLHYFRRGYHQDLPLHLYRIRPNFPMTVLVGHRHNHKIRDRRWITAPAWLMATGTYTYFGGHMTISSPMVMSRRARHRGPFTQGGTSTSCSPTPVASSIPTTNSKSAIFRGNASTPR